MAGEWPVVRFGDLADSISDTHRFGRRELIFLNTSDVLRGKILHHSYSAVEGWPGQAKKSIRKGDILFSEIRPANGRYAYVDIDGDDYVVSTKLMVIRAREGVLPRFLFHYLTSTNVTSWLQHLAESRSGTFPQITFDQVAELELNLPPKDTQAAVIGFVDSLDDKIELNQRMNETLETIALAVFKSWFVDFDPVRANVEGRDPGLPKHLADLFPARFVDSELGEIPEGWEVAPLADCVEVARGLSYKGSGLSHDGVPMHNLNSIYEGGDYKHDGLKYYQGEYKPHHVARAGDLIVANTEQGHHLLLIGYAAVVPACFDGESLFSHHIYRVRPKNSSGLTSDYLCKLLNTRVMHDTVSGYANGTTVNMLPIDGLQSPLILVPPSQVVATFNDIAEAARKRHEEMVEESRTLAALRDTLLPKLISGELRVKDAERIVEIV